MGHWLTQQYSLFDSLFILLFVTYCFADWLVRSSRGRPVRSDRSSQRNAPQGVRHNQKRVSFNDGQRRKRPAIRCKCLLSVIGNLSRNRTYFWLYWAPCAGIVLFFSLLFLIRFSFSPSVLFHATAFSRTVWSRGCRANTAELAWSACGLGNSRAGKGGRLMRFIQRHTRKKNYVKLFVTPWSIVTAELFIVY